jgi:phage terminase small subunit
MANLTPKQQRFVEEYLIDLNATQSAIRAGYSEKTAEQLGYQLLQKTSVLKAIEEAKNQVSKRTELTVDMVVNGLLKEAQDYAEGSTQSARVSAWAHLGKHLGMFTEKVQHSGPDGGPVQVATKATLTIKVVKPDGDRAKRD